jgi:hypothetical protein
MFTRRSLFATLAGLFGARKLRPVALPVSGTEIATRFRASVLDFRKFRDAQEVLNNHFSLIAEGLLKHRPPPRIGDTISIRTPARFVADRQAGEVHIEGGERKYVTIT